MTGGPGFQIAIGEFLTRVFGRIETWTSSVPEPVLGLAVLTLAAVFVVAMLRGRRSPEPAAEAPTKSADEPACHHHDTDAIV
jgi:hypothetical protein